MVSNLDETKCAWQPPVSVITNLTVWESKRVFWQLLLDYFFSSLCSQTCSALMCPPPHLESFVLLAAPDSITGWSGNSADVSNVAGLKHMIASSANGKIQKDSEDRARLPQFGNIRTPKRCGIPGTGNLEDFLFATRDRPEFSLTNDQSKAIDAGSNASPVQYASRAKDREGIVVLQQWCWCVGWYFLGNQMKPCLVAAMDICLVYSRARIFSWFSCSCIPREAYCLSVIQWQSKVAKRGRINPDGPGYWNFVLFLNEV